MAWEKGGNGTFIFSTSSGQPSGWHKIALRDDFVSIAPSASRIQSMDGKTTMYSDGQYVFFSGESATYKIDIYFDGNSMWARRTEKSSGTQTPKLIVDFTK